MEIGTRVLVAHPVMAFGVVLRSSGGVEDNSETVHASRFSGPTTCGETASESALLLGVVLRERLTSSTMFYPAGLSPPNGPRFAPLTFWIAFWM